jgi:hypothetical protein
VASTVLGVATTLALALAAVKVARLDITTGLEIRMKCVNGDAWTGKVIWGRARTALNVLARPEKPLAELRGQRPPQELLEFLPYGRWREAVRTDALPAGTTRCFWNHQAYGWPMRALSAGFHNPGGGGVWRDRSETGWARFPHVPTGVIWPGLVVDSALFSLAWVVVLSVPVAIVRWQRRRRGVCPGCGYSRDGISAGAPCPECGTPASRTRAAPSTKA